VDQVDVGLSVGIMVVTQCIERHLMILMGRVCEDLQLLGITPDERPYETRLTA
jgi:hypothetical protein